MIYITVERIVSGKVRTVREWIDYVGTDHIHHGLFLLLGDKWRAVLTIFLYSTILGLSSIVLRNARRRSMPSFLSGRPFLSLSYSLY